jgi:hypothetical protein
MDDLQGREYFVKYCKSQHNIALSCATVQVGTLEY